MRVFLDTNVLASAVATRGICADVLQVTLAEHDLVVGEQVLLELRRVLVKKFRAPAEVADEVDEFLRREAEVVAETQPVEVGIRDADDLIVISQAVAGGAEVLVTGDRDFLDLKSAAPLRILSPRGFWDFLRETARDDE